MRLNSMGQVYNCEYDVVQKGNDLIHFNMPLLLHGVYGDPYTCWSKHALWDRLYKSPSCLGVFIANQEYLVSVYDTGVVCMETRMDKEDDEGQTFTTQITRLLTPNRAVGWVKTIPDVKSVPILPYRLMVDGLGRYTLDGKTIHTLPDAVDCSDISLYAALINSPYQAVYMSLSGPKYL